MTFTLMVSLAVAGLNFSGADNESLALGITDEVELAEAKGSKKSKSKQLGVDFTVSSIHSAARYGARD